MHGDGWGWMGMEGMEGDVWSCMEMGMVGAERGWKGMGGDAGDELHSTQAFCRILCTLVHFGENMVILGAPSVRIQMCNCGYLATEGPTHVCRPSCLLPK